MTDKATITVNGTEHGGWTSVDINMGIEQLAPTFNLSFTDRWGAQDLFGAAEPVSIREGDACTIKINGDLILTGYVDTFNETESRQQHSMTVTGRAKTMDLVDCSAIIDGWQLRQKKIEDIAEALCAPFGIKVELLAPIPIIQPLDTGDPIRLFRVEQGETAHEALVRITRKTGLLMQTTAQGNLQLSRAPTVPVVGGIITRTAKFSNVIGQSSYTNSFEGRFDRYILKSQVGGDDDTNGVTSAQLEEEQRDDEVGRYRPLLILAEHPSERASLKVRAKWEANRRGASEKLSYQLQGWSHIQGIWNPNIQVRVDDDRYDVHDFMLVTSVGLGQTKAGGTIASVQVTGPEAFDVFSPPKRRRKRDATLAQVRAAQERNAGP